MIWLILLIPICIPLINTFFNMISWPQGRSGLPSSLSVSVLIPARNEENNIANCVHAICQSTHPIHEVIVYNDNSTDNTGSILNDLQSSYPSLKIINGPPLPTGWVGKPHACHQLSMAATGELLLFIDADTRLKNDGLARIAHLLRNTGLDGRPTDILSAMPHQEQHGFIEQLIMPMLHLTYYAWLPLIFTRWFNFSSMLAANGQIMAIRRSCYDAIGGFAAVRDAIVDDMAICRRAKQKGFCVLFADGRFIATCRMYNSAKELWNGFSKNIYQGIGRIPSALIVLIVIHLTCFIFPYIALGVGMFYAPEMRTPAFIAVALNLVLRVVIAVRHKHSWLSVLLHPIAVLGMIAIAINSFRWSHQQSIFWRGRIYGSEV